MNGTVSRIGSKRQAQGGKGGMNAVACKRSERWAAAAASDGEPISFEEIRTGDIIEFTDSAGGKIRLRVEVGTVLNRTRVSTVFTGVRIKRDGSQGGTHNYGAGKRSNVVRLLGADA